MEIVTLNGVKGAMLEMAPFAALRVTTRGEGYHIILTLPAAIILQRIVRPSGGTSWP
jgi:hypothetical protein